MKRVRKYSDNVTVRYIQHIVTEYMRFCFSNLVTQNLRFVNL